jgi:hypothetical protein
MADGIYTRVKQKLETQENVWSTAKAAAIDILVSQAQAKLTWCADVVSSLCLSITPSPTTPAP